MKVLAALTYYRPHVSGLTIYVERLARALARRGHTVTVLTSQYDRSLPLREAIDGVEVVRVPVAARVSKGVIMPTIGFIATRLVREHDVLSLHLPQLDASGIALRGRLFRKPCVLTYHSDLLLPPGLVNRAANLAVDLSNHVAARLSTKLCAYTDDFARHSRLLAHYLGKVRLILPPVEMSRPSVGETRRWAEAHGLVGQGPIIGVAVRLAAEKGIEYLLEALPVILKKYPNARVLHAGPVEQVIGEDAYRARLRPLLDQHAERYTFLGTLDPAEMALFFSNCDVHVLPSINNTETFGLVQIEAALCGTPTVASDLPGVRVPSRITGMGLTAPPCDAGALAGRILEVLDNPAAFSAPPEDLAAQFSPDRAAAEYENLFTELLAQQY
ncbi:MAG: glycosyltransferase family 4 protein [Anaerolineales bacterium]